MHPPNLLKFGQIWFLDESVVCKSNFKFLQAVKFFIMSDIFMAAKYFETHIQVHPLNQMSKHLGLFLGNWAIVLQWKICHEEQR